MIATARAIPVEIWPKRLRLGIGSLGALQGLLDELGARRALVLCGRTVASGPLLQRTLDALGDRCCGVYDQVASHTPLAMVEGALAQVRASAADAVVTVGGGSAIDAGKGVVLLTMTGGDLDPYAVAYDEHGAMRHRRLPHAPLVHVAIPTTSGSASEVMPTAGIRDPAARKKMLFWDDALIPDGVILDPVMAVETRPFLTAASGMTAVARCIESLYSADRNPLAEGLALHALRLLHRNLPRVVAAPDDLTARYECQVACAMSGIAAINAMVSVVHAVGHIVGGRYGLQHGVSHAILLAPAMRRLLPTIGERQSDVLVALGEHDADPDAAGVRAADLIERLVAALPLQGRLRDLGVTEDELPEVAAQSARDYMMKNVPRPMDAREIETLLRGAW